MKDRTKTGKAYAFLDHESDADELLRLMAINQRRANFSDDLSFKVLDDKTSPAYDPEKKGLPAEIADVARTTDVYGQAPISMAENLMSVMPRKAADLRFVLEAQATEVIFYTGLIGPIGKGKSNQITAGMLNEVLRILGGRECEAGQREYLRTAVFYQDGRGKAKRYL